MLDNNNIYTRYHYDAIGRLISVSKEVMGKSFTPTVKAITYNYWKLHISPSTTIYARLNYNDYSPSTTYNSGAGYSPDVVTTTNTDVSIQFFTDATCSTPYVLTSPITVSVSQVEQQYGDLVDNFQYIFNLDYICPAGSSSHLITSYAVHQIDYTTYDSNNYPYYGTYQMYFTILDGVNRDYNH